MFLKTRSANPLLFTDVAAVFDTFLLTARQKREYISMRDFLFEDLC